MATAMAAPERQQAAIQLESKPQRRRTSLWSRQVSNAVLLILTDVAGDRGNFDTEVLLGPSIQFRPLPQMTINFAPLVGLTDDSPDAQIYLNIGWEF